MNLEVAEHDCAFSTHLLMLAVALAERKKRLGQEGMEGKEGQDGEEGDIDPSSLLY